MYRDKKKLMDDRKTKLTQERDRSPRFEDMLRNSKASFTKKSIPNHSNENKKDLPSNFFEALSRSSSNCGIKPSSSITKIESKTNSLSPLGSSLSINKNKAVYNNVHKNDHNVSKSSTYKTQIQGKENIQRGASSNYIKESKMIVKNPKISLFEQRRQEKLSRQTCFMSKTKPILETVPSLPLVNSFLACDNEILEQEVPSLATNSVPEDPLADIEVPADQKNNTFEFEGELSLTKQSRPELLELSFEKTNVDLPQKEIFYENEVQECRDLARDFCFSEVTPLKEEQHKPEEQLPKDKFNFDNDNLDDWIERFNYDEWDSNTVMAEEQDEAEEGKSLFDVHDLDAATEFGFEDDDNFLNDEFGTDKSGCDVAFTPLKQSNLSEFKMNTASPFACKNGNRSQTKQPQLNEQDVLAENQSKEVDHDFSLEEKITPYRQIKTIKSIKNVSQFDFMEEEFKEKELKRKRQDFEQDFAIKESSLETQGLKKYSTTQSKAIADNKCHEKITISNFIDSSFPESMNQMVSYITCSILINVLIRSSLDQVLSLLSFMLRSHSKKNMVKVTQGL